MIIFRPSVDGDARFLGYATDCPQAACQKARIGRGITVMHIYWGGLKYMTVALPPLPEQTAIVRFLDKATANIDTAITRAHRQIALLPEYRTRLIADVVTGKLDGREVAAARPEGDPLVADTLNDTLDINTESDPDELAGPLQEAEA